MTLDYESVEPVDEWHAAIGPWQPRPLTRAEPPMRRRQKAWLLLAIAVGHVVAFWILDYSSRFKPTAFVAETTTLVFLFPDPPEPVRPDPPQPIPKPQPEPRVEARLPARAAESTPAPVAAPRVTDPPRRRDPAPMVAVEAAPRADEPLRLFEADGSLALPDDVVARLEEVEGDGRTFDFQLPGLMEAGRFMDRQPVMAYEPTRFDRYWIPEKDVLTEILEKAVEATTDSIEIPIPGSPGSKLVCTISILALGGGCGIRNNNDGYVVQLDDPDTLNPEEDAQCRAWWEQIVAAGDQAAWRRTRDLYEFSCRKPLAKDPSPPG